MKNRPDYKSRFRILKGGKISLMVSVLIGSVTILSASPTGGTVTSGSASIVQNGTTTNITQSSNKATINWQNFSISSNETVNFAQPNVNSITLNRVIGNEKSIINGALNANGQIWILNSNGVLFNSTARVNTAGFLATTKALSDADFNAGNYTFNGDSTDSVINMGTINISDSGYASLLANTVTNEGTITALRGKVTLTGASEATINLNGNSLINLTVNKGALDALVENKGAIIADGGEVYLTTNAVNELLKGVVNNTGLVEANSLDDVAGKIELYAHGGEAQVGGTLSADKGFIETSGESLRVSDGTIIKAKEWLLDPISDLTIDSALATTTDNTLNGGTNVTLTAGNNINVNQAMAWSRSVLTLSAGNDININAQMDLTSTAGLSLLYAQPTSTGTYNVNALVNIATTGSFSTQHASNAIINYTIIDALGSAGSTTAADLQGINGGLTGNYVLGANIDASATSTWNASVGFMPIGNSSTNFTGTFDGLGHTITDLTINLPSQDYVGLFGYTGSSAVVRNIGLVNENIIGNFNIGGLVGYNTGAIIGAYTTGIVNGANNIGGLVGHNESSITNAYSTGSVSGNEHVGGLVGENNSLIENSYATGTVSAPNNVGGLVGTNNGTITDSYAIGSVTGSEFVGGLVGYNYGSITNTYATGSVSGSGYYVGGLVGENDGGTITDSYWDIDTTQQSSGGNNDGSTTNLTGVHSSTGTINTFTQGTYTGFDFTNTWFMINGSTRPFLRSEYSTTITNDHQLQLIAMHLGASYTLSNDIAYTVSMWSGAGFAPIGTFAGIFDGLGHTISGLTINLPSNSSTGLFKTTSTSAVIKNIGLVNENITGSNYSGGLVGTNNGSIINVYATGNVNGTSSYIGGLVGLNYGSITDSYATVNVSGDVYTAGLVGRNDGTITDAYATGNVSGSSILGGLIGFNNGGLITDSYWNTQTTNQSVGIKAGTATGATGLTSAEMAYGKFYSDAGWIINVNSLLTSGAPTLLYSGGTASWQIAPLALSYTLTPQTSTYNGQDQLLSDMYATPFGTDYAFLNGGYHFSVGGNSVTSYKNAGIYNNLQVASDNSFLTINSSGNTDGSFTITPKAITVTAVANDKTYDATTAAIATLDSSDIISGDTVTLDGIVSFADKNVATGKTVTVASLTKSGTDAGNYTISNAIVTDTADITAKAITVTADSISKMYGMQDPTLTYAEIGLLGNDTLSGALTRTAGEASGNYDIAEGTLSADANYAITFIKGVFTIKSDIQKYITPITNSASAGSQPSYPVSANAFAANSVLQQTNSSAGETVNKNIPIVVFGSDDVFTIISGGLNLPAGLTQDLLLVQNTNTTNYGDKN